MHQQAPQEGKRKPLGEASQDDPSSISQKHEPFDPCCCGLGSKETVSPSPLLRPHHNHRGSPPRSACTQEHRSPGLHLGLCCPSNQPPASNEEASHSQLD